MLKRIKALGKWAKKKLTSSVTADEVIELFRKKKVHRVILEPACYWRPSVRHLFRHRLVINYIGTRQGVRGSMRRQEALLFLKGRSTNEYLKERIIDLSPVVYKRLEKILDGVPNVRVGIDNEYLKALGNNIYILPQKKVGRI